MKLSACMQVHSACIGIGMHASAYCMYRHKCLYVCMYVCLYACVYCMKKNKRCTRSVNI